jgi:TPR repeat protein
LDSRFALPANTVLDGAYRIVRVVGTGGFGITYEAEDIALRTAVALKEYYPDEFGDRDARMSVRPKSERHRQTFEWGRANFIKEARTLARFEHPSIVRVSRVFEANSTAYMVMSFERGRSFESWLTNLGRPPTQEELDGIVAPLLDALEMLHASSFLHRDIAPDNIIVRADGSPVLLDFGAARQAVAAMSRSLTGIVKVGYSPHEQYASDGRLQGPWSDLYALGGTLYRAITGSPPEEATLRVDDDRMAPAVLAAKGSYRPGFLTGIDACLKVRHSDRPRSVAQLRPLLFTPAGQTTASKPPASAVRRPSMPPQAMEHAPAAPKAGRRAMAAAAAVLFIAAGAFAGYAFTRWQKSAEPATNISIAQAELEAQRRKDAEAARQRAESEAEAQRKTQSEAAQRADAEKRRQEDEARAARETADRRKAELDAEAAARQRADADAEARRKAQAEAEERRKEEERRRIASREDPSTSAPGNTPSSRPGKLMKVRVKLASSPNEGQGGWLGVTVEPVERPLAVALGLPDTGGVLVLEAVASGPAALAGLRLGDIVVALNERAVADSREFIQRLASMVPGSEAGLEIWRAGDSSNDFVRIVRRLATEGNAAAMYRLGRLHAAGQGVARDEPQAASWYRKGADAGDAASASALAAALLEGRGVAVDKPEAVRLLRSASAQGNAEAMSILGRMLVEGRNVGKDPTEGSRLLTAASEAGYTPAMVDYARILLNGTAGVPADAAKAAFWFRRAADLGNANGMAGLGSLYQQGKGVEADLTKAVMWYTRGADRGSAVAMSDLGLLHVQGKGVERNEATAVALFRKSAALGNSIAMNNLAWMLQLGRGVDRKNPAEAADFMMRSLERGNEFSHKQMTEKSNAWSKEFRQALQIRLRDAGLYKGPLDGEFRDTTIAAINAQFNRLR